jgi:hypothetical protein
MLISDFMLRHWLENNVGTEKLMMNYLKLRAHRKAGPESTGQVRYSPDSYFIQRLTSSS